MNLKPTQSSYMLSYIDDLHHETKHYENFVFEDYIDLHEKSKNVKTILSIKSNLTVENFQLCPNDLYINNNNSLSISSLLTTTIKISFQTKYVGGSDNKSVFVDTKNFYKIMFIPVPPVISDISISDYYRKNRINVKVYVDDLQTTSINNNMVKFSLIGLVNIKFIKSSNVN